MRAHFTVQILRGVDEVSMLPIWTMLIVFAMLPKEDWATWVCSLPLSLLESTSEASRRNSFTLRLDIVMGFLAAGLLCLRALEQESESQM